MKRVTKQSILTAKQLECLRELAKPGAYARHTGVIRGEWYWYVVTNRRRATKQVVALLDRGLIKLDRRKHRFVSQTARINAAGRKALNGASRA